MLWGKQCGLLDGVVGIVLERISMCRFLLIIPSFSVKAREATELALKDEKQLMEIEFPTAGLGSSPGDGEGGTEMTRSMQLIREFCDRLVTPEKVTRTRIFFPEASEVKVARKSAFEGVSFKLDYLTKPSIFQDFGFATKVKMSDRVKPEELFLVAYPYFNVDEMLVCGGTLQRSSSEHWPQTNHFQWRT